MRLKDWIEEMNWVLGAKYMDKKITEDGWVRWEGGSESPVASYVTVVIKLISGMEAKCLASDAPWSNVVRYKVLTAPVLESARTKQEGGKHYKSMGVQPWDVFDTWPIEQQIGFHRGNAIKYLMRMGAKDTTLQEVKKAKHYVEKLIEILEKQGG